MGETEIPMKENMGARDDGRPSWVAKIESDDSLLSRMVPIECFKKKEMYEWKKHSIYKVPEGFVRDKQRVQLYEPQVVSLGPYHHWKEQLRAMEEHKLRALRHVHRRAKKSVEEYREALKEGEVLQKLMDAYKDLDPWWKDNKEEFLKMMILDGCFMLEVMRVVTTNDFNDYAENDPVFSYHGMLSNLSRMKRDMLMLENQIPLLVLHKIFAVQEGLIHEQDKQKQWELYQEVNHMVVDFFQQEKMETPPSLKTRFMRRMHRSFVCLSSKQTSAADTGASTNTGTSTSTSTRTTTPPVRRMHRSSDDQEEGGLHVLDVVRKSTNKDIKGRRRRSGGVQTGSYDVIWPATQLEEAGIQFRKSDITSLKDITFQTGFLHATLSLPQLLVDDSTESKLFNLMAFEHRHTGLGKEVSSYVCFMNKIIKSDKDVSLLSENNIIIKNFMGTDQAVADLFNGICYDISIDPTSDLGSVHHDVANYCNDPFNKHWASKYLVDLKRSYFKSPWTFISLLAAILLISLTIIQSVYTMLQYYKPD